MHERSRDVTIMTSYMYTHKGITIAMTSHECHDVSDHWQLINGMFKLITVHDDIIKWELFLRYWPFVWVIDRSPVNSPHKGQWRGALMFSLICVWLNGWVSNRVAGDLRRYRAHYDVTVMGKFHSAHRRPVMCKPLPCQGIIMNLRNYLQLSTVITRSNIKWYFIVHGFDERI